MNKIAISKIALGTAQFGLSYGIANQTGQVPLGEIGLMLDLALKGGIDTLDTAMTYGDSEIRLGQENCKRFNLVTKLPPAPVSCDDIRGWVMGEIKKSLRCLNTNSLYGLLLHRSQNLSEKYGVELYNALREIKNEGVVSKIGVSIYSPTELNVLIPRYDLDLIQAPFNIFDNRIVSSGWVSRLKERNIEIHARSIFLQGLLLMKESDIPLKFHKWKMLFSQWFDWLKAHKQMPLETCLAYALSRPEIDRIIVGAESASQLAEILHASIASTHKYAPDFICNDEWLINPSNWSKI